MFSKIFLVLFGLLFFATPLLMAPFTSELFEYNKLIFIYLITIGVVFFWVLKMILNRKIIIKKTPFDIPILLFFFSQVVSTLFSIDPHTSFYGYYGRFNGGLLSIISYILLYYGFVANFQSDRKTEILQKLLKTSLFSSFIAIIWGLSGKLGFDFSCMLFVGQIGNSCWTDQFRPAERMFSTLGQPNWLGAYLAINFFIGLSYWLNNLFTSKKINLKYVLLSSYLLLNFSAVLFTRSRSALFAVVSGLLFLGVYFFLYLKTQLGKQERKLFLPLLVLLVLSVLLFKTGVEKIDRLISPSFGTGRSQQSKELKTPATTADSSITTSADIRKIVWRGAWKLGMMYPLFGTGVETFAYSYYFTRPWEHNLTSEWDYLYNKAHNEYLNYLSTTGFTGLLAYLILIGSVLFYGWRNFKFEMLNVKSGKKDQRDSNRSNITIQQYNNSFLILCLLVSYITILITNFFGFSTTTVNLFFYLIPAFLLVIFNKPAESNTTLFAIKRISKIQKLWLLLLLTVTCYLLLNLSRYYLADIKYSKGDNFSKLGDYQNAVKYLSEAIDLKSDHVYEDKLSNVYANIAFTAAYQKEEKIAGDIRKTADDLNLKTLNSAPKNVLYWKTRAKNFYLFYQMRLDPKDLEQAIYALQKARTLSPTDPKIPYSLAIFYSLLEEETKDAKQKTQYQHQALREIEESTKLKPNYRDGYFLKGQLLKKSGKTDEAKAAFEHILVNLDPKDVEVKKEIESL